MHDDDDAEHKLNYKKKSVTQEKSDGFINSRYIFQIGWIWTW